MLNLSTTPTTPVVTATKDTKMTTPKKQINPSDYKLLYIRVNKIRDEYNHVTHQMERKFWFEHIENRYSPADHIWSADKNKVDHIYNEIEQDHYYVIFAHRVEDLTQKKKNGDVYSRWVWRFALDMPDKLIRKAYKFYKINEKDAKLCLKYADELMHPKIADNLDEFEFATPQVEQ